VGRTGVPSLVDDICQPLGPTSATNLCIYEIRTNCQPVPLPLGAQAYFLTKNQCVYILELDLRLNAERKLRSYIGTR